MIVEELIEELEQYRGRSLSIVIIGYWFIFRDALNKAS